MSSAYFMIKFLQKKRKQLTNKSRHSNCREDVGNDNNICRVCMKDASIPIFDQTSSFDIAEAMRNFCEINISLDDNHPKHICAVCHTFLINALSFRKLAKESDDIFHQSSHKLNDDGIILSDGDNTNENVSNMKSYSCKLCKLHFKSWEDRMMHKNTRSHKNVRIQCNICHGILSAQLYKKHLARHQSATHLICDVCGKLYRKDNLVRHLQLHTYELPFKCQICPYKGRFMESLKIHMRTHSGYKPFSCDKCEMQFLTRSNLNRHLLTHKKERPFKCAECGRSFHIQRDLDSHFMVDHTGLKDFNCRLCGNKYGTRKALMRHELKVHKRDKMSKGRVPLYMQAEYQSPSEK